MKLIDITGSRYGRLKVIKKHEKPAKKGGSLWDCICDCGNKKVVNGSNLRNGSTQSCGCLSTENSRKLGSNPDFIKKRAESITKHGHKKRSGVSVEYRTWLSIKRRCYDTKYKDYQSWGGRGISVCDRWNESFQSFLEDMGPRPSGDYSIDRIDVNGDYSPENCRWATMHENRSENMRAHIKFEFQGRSYHTLKEACRELGISYGSTYQRLRSGLPMDQVLDKEKRSRWKNK